MPLCRRAVWLIGCSSFFRQWPSLSSFWLTAPVICANAGSLGALMLLDVGDRGTVAMRRHREGRAQVYVTTVQAIIAKGGSTLRALREGLLPSGAWMIVVDEFSSLWKLEKAWGQAIAALPYVFRLVMSATPYRNDNDEAFGKPDIVVTYRQAVEEGEVKRLRCHSYVYKIDVRTSGRRIRHVYDR